MSRVQGPENRPTGWVNRLSEKGGTGPKVRRTGTLVLIKWFLFIFALLYILLSYYHAPILTRLGRYLVVAQSPVKSDLIVCLAGANIERGLATVDAYRQGLAPRIFLSQEELPDGYDLLKEKGLHYPRSVDLLAGILKQSGVPESAIILGTRPVKSTLEEAEGVRSFVREQGLRSIIIITSPTHTRRAWLTYRKVFRNSGIRIQMVPTTYSGYDPETWWKERRYVREVIIEYQKLIFYTLRYLI